MEILRGISLRLLRLLIDMTKRIDESEPHDCNKNILYNLRACLALIEFRAAHESGRSPMGFMTSEVTIELQPTCSKCGHIGCEGNCHTRKEPK